MAPERAYAVSERGRALLQNLPAAAPLPTGVRCIHFPRRAAESLAGLEASRRESNISLEGNSLPSRNSWLVWTCNMSIRCSEGGA